MTNNEKELYFYVYRKNAKFSFLQIECARHENHATTALDFPGLFIFVLIVLLPSISKGTSFRLMLFCIYFILTGGNSEAT